ncbi:MAG: type II toxin-antitoxin system VapC family toxin [Pseudonocardia sp.]
MTTSRAVVVADASAVVAMLSDARAPGQWATACLVGAQLAAPRLMPFEAANAFRRQQRVGELDATGATLAQLDLQSLPVQLWPHQPLAERAWQLRDNFSYYDACYLALAELLDAPLVTLDRRLAQAPGPRCVVLTPPE